MADTAYEARNVTASTTWTKVLEANPERAEVKIFNTDVSIACQYLFPDKGNPWALSFDGIDDEASSSSASFVNHLVTSHKGSIVARFLVDATTGAERTIFSVSDASSAGDYFQLKVDTNGYIVARLFVGSASVWTMTHNFGGSTITASQYYVVEIRQDGVLPIMILNGAKVAVDLTAVTDKTAWFNALPAALTDEVYVGARQVSSTEDEFFAGDIDLVYVYDKIKSKTPIAMYDFDEGTSTSVADKSGNAYTLTIAGTETWVVTSTGNYLHKDSVEVMFDTSNIHNALWLVADSGSPVVNIEEKRL